ncbi:hypothetical protein GW819_03655 [Candidatus Gracilibacteria bacterium]|nr:hypothetical protein [Candidatus Gracilibacteria bacterium]OIO76511.1 MAG: hypothetical protein AUJ87_02725 [Candidatus Gracilibacteria bacterium CG1_02_38_174]PIQ12387.1 MAG: hypothetical protein COW68_00040 [Candidatus Gracilibacteria bacterium CG18_big_fil_WC_8_21_14_2_50_38_16]PIQ41661.1 MAG: hypothetical protein COW06_02180 [Candidatus Gracilibacteria bacterium CG12_big_fil_rev_8_21_14_0_65_38_15]PIZ01320.1 MAG: hypothetical protein COY60_04155 [Candidatus Gracilibacteria bacterium CG_4
MYGYILTLIVSLLLSLSSSVWADSDYIGKELGNDIYRIIDQGTYTLKKKLVDNRLKEVATAEKMNNLIKENCPECFASSCFASGKGFIQNFTASDLEEIAGGSVGTIYTHLSKDESDTDQMNTDQITKIIKIFGEFYQTIQSQVNTEQQKLQSIGSIGLFSDGDKENSSYDLMVDLEKIHKVIFASDLPYEGTANMGAASLVNLLDNAYGDLSPLVSGTAPTIPSNTDPGVSLIPPTTSSGGALPLTASGILAALGNGSGCIASASNQTPTNLDPSFLTDVQSQLLVGTNQNSSLAFSDNGQLPESSASLAQANNLTSGLGGGGGYSDTYPCSTFFCVVMSMTSYTQNVLAGGQAATIEKILDQNLKIVNTFASSSFTQAKMTKNFLELSIKDLNLPDILHIGVVVSSLPPPILNIKKPASGGGNSGGNSGGSNSGEDDEFNKILIGTFEEQGLDFKRQNSLENTNEAHKVNNCFGLKTDDCSIGDIIAPSGFAQAKDIEIKKSYGDSFNDDLFELHSFTVAFTKTLQTLTGLIAGLEKIPK